MRWPWSSRKDSDENDKAPKTRDPNGSPRVSWADSLNATDWSHYTDPRNVGAVVTLTGTCLFFVAFYRSYLRRIDAAVNINPGFFRRRSLLGYVTSVGDGDNFRLFHTPGGRLAGWGWIPWRKVPVKKEDLKDRTIHIRLAGVDAPELAHFGRPAQPGSKEALDWLTSYILHRRVRAYIYKRDQYDRIVSTVYVRRGLFRRDVGLQMLRQGHATVYEAKSGAEFGTLENTYRRAEWWAKKKRKGIWHLAKSDYESPREYKTRMGLLDEEVGKK